MPLQGMVSALAIPLRATVTHASAARATSDSVWVEVRRAGRIGLGEGCPRPYVTGERTAEAVAWVRDVGRGIAGEATDIGELRASVADAAEEIDRHPAAWCALELALLDLLAREAGITVERLLDVAETTTRFRYSAVVDDVDDERFAHLTRQYAVAGMGDVKLKLSGDTDVDVPRVASLLEQAGNGHRPGGSSAGRLRLDANNLWGTDVAAACAGLEALPPGFAAVEEPLAPGHPAELTSLAEIVGVPMILDESLRTTADVAEHAAHAGPWVANVKVSKCGGLVRSIAVIDAALGQGWPVVVGAQFGETSLLTRAGMVAARAARTALFAHEGAFGTHLLTHDAVAPVLTFGRAGVLDLEDVPGGGDPGFGLRRMPANGMGRGAAWGG